MSVWDGEERFSLLLLEEDEYYFRDHSCLYWKDAEQKIPGHLKVCSNALYFVPRAIQEPIYRIPYRRTLHIDRVVDEDGYASEDTFYVTAEERVSLKMHNKNVPYATSVGLYEFRFQLVYTSLEEQLAKIKELWDLALRRKGREGDANSSAKQRLNAIIQAHEGSEGFNPGWLEDENERVVVELPGSCVSPLCSQPGRVALTSTRIYFQPFNISSNSPVEVYQLNKAQALIKRTYLLKDVGLEIFFSGRNSLYLTFKSTADRDRLAGLLEQQAAAQLQSAGSRKRWTRDWRRGRVSNFEYLMFLNREAGRSFKDLTQYPVFPWIIRDYTSQTLDLSNPAVYRDLSKPIGALNPKRFQDFIERFREQKEMNSFQNAKFPTTQSLDFPPFLYGCHFSTPGYVVFYLMRSQPQLMLRLQNGRFDAPDRLFWSIQDTWNSVMTLPTDVKELIPEFYSSDHMFLVNAEGVDFGERTSGAKVGDVELPAWAADAPDFAAKLAQALESPQVSGQLHAWIDLIFGCKSQGPGAEKADNLFHYLTYDGIALQHLEQETNPTMREALRVQMMEFGRTPKQLFRKPHPRRRVAVTGGKPAGACGCFGGPPAAQAARPAANVLHPTFVQGRSAKVSAVSKAVERLPSRKSSMRAATLAWLETAARTREPEYLQLSSHTELLPILKAAQDSQDGPEGAEMREVLARALRALAVSPLNCSLILDAGGLEPLTEMLCGPDQELAHQALVVMSLLSKEDDQRLAGLPLQTIEHILALLPAAVGDTPHERVPSQAGRADSALTGADVRMAAASTVANLSRSLANRNSISSVGGPIMLLAVAQQEDEVPTVRREAIAALVAVLEDDKRKIELADRGGLPVLVELAESDDAWLRDLRAASTRCLALLSTADVLKPRLVDAGVLPLLCHAAHPSGEPTADAELQRPAAAALANLCSEVSLAERLVQAGGMQALAALSQSHDRQVQEHAARAFWHLAVEDSDAVFDAVMGSPSLAAMLRLASPEVTKGAQLARQALRRLCEDPDAGDALVTEIARMNAAQRSAKSASAYLNHLIGTPHNSQYNTPVDTPSGSQTSGSPFRPPAHLLHTTSAGRDSSGTDGHLQGTPPVTRRRHRRIGSSASLDSRSSQPSPLKRGDMNASLPATPSQPLRSGGPEDLAKPSPLSRAPVDNAAVPKAAVIGANEGQDMPDMAQDVPSHAEPSAPSSGALTPGQVIAATVSEASTFMQDKPAEPGAAQAPAKQGADSSSQPSLLPNGALKSHRLAGTLATPEKEGST